MAKRKTINVMAGDDLAAAIASASENSRVLLEPGAVFELNAPVQTATNMLTLDGQGASIRIGSRPTAETLELDCLFRMTGSDQLIENLNFVTRARGTNSTDAAATNVRLDGLRGVVQGCTFTTGSKSAIACMGPAARGNKIVGNYLKGSGVTYSWEGASSTMVANNTIENAPGNALSGIGNLATGYNQDCWVADNVINKPGRMGIEDHLRTRSTVIRGNHINSPANTGISSVGYGSIIEGNTIVDPSHTHRGIETASHGTVVRSNTVTYSSVVPSNGAGIVVSGGRGGILSGATLSGNAIHAGYCGVQLIGEVTVVTITGHIVTDAVQCGISLEPSAAEAVTCTGNTIRFSSPGNSSAGFRDGILVATQSVTLSGNSIAYTPASVGRAKDYAIRPVADAIVIVGNTVNGGGRTDPGKPKLTSHDAAPANLIIANNAFLGGAILDTRGMTTPMRSNNVTA